MSRWLRKVALGACAAIMGLRVTGGPVAARVIDPMIYPNIPTIDLAHETQRQVIVDREPGQYLGHPSTVLLDDDRTMIVVYPRGHGRGAIHMKRSSDGGLTWSERLPVPKNWETSQESPTIYRMRDALGMERLVLFSGVQPVRSAVSEDGGKTWTELAPIGNFGGIVAMSSVVRLSDGSYMALAHHHAPNVGILPPDMPAAQRAEWARRIFAGQMVVYKTISRDGGLTWSWPEVVAGLDGLELSEPGAVRSPDGRQIAVLMRENTRKRNSMIIFSNDEGETWSEPVELPAALTGDRHVARYAPDGRLVIVFRDLPSRTGASPTPGDFVAWVGTYEDLVAGREGQYRVRLLDNKGSPYDTGYAGLELLPDGTFVATTYAVLAEGEAPLVVSVRFTLEELDKKPPAFTIDLLR